MIETAVEVKELSVKFGQFYAVKNVSFSVKKGEIFGFLGANGAGKSTLIKVLCGLLKPSTGVTRIDGQTFCDRGHKIKEKIGYMSQKFNLYNDLSILENLTFYSQIRKIPDSIFQERKKKLLDFIDFELDVHDLVKNLSGGIKQRVSLITALLHDPSVIFLDEPTAGVTPKTRFRFWQLIKILAAEGKTVFVTTHYMDEAEQCDRIAIMKTGDLVAIGTLSELKQREFPMGLYELEPKPNILLDDILELAHKSGDFSLIEAYGMRFHVEIKDIKTWDEKKSYWQQWFLIQAIEPSLEDVFIRISGKKEK